MIDMKECRAICRRAIYQDSEPYCIECGRTQEEINKQYIQHKELSGKPVPKERYVK